MERGRDLERDRKGAGGERGGGGEGRRGEEPSGRGV